MIDTEILSPEELEEITGYTSPGSQKLWLDTNGWKYVLTAARRPIVGRWFARMRLAGVQPSSSATVEQTAWQPDFSAFSKRK